MAVAITYLLFDKFYLAPRLADGRVEDSATAEPAGPAPAAEQAAPDPVSRQSIAVLPFDNRSRLEEDEFFVEGIHDDLLTNLARIGSLKVISRTSVSQYRDTNKTIPQIAGELGVATIMEGAVQRSGATVRINVQLIDAQTDEHLWAEIFDRELTADNLFAIQSEISAEIAKALEATLSPDEQQRLSEQPTENLAAYNAYLRGRQLVTRRNSEDMDQAAREFQRAVELDPGFALAWVGIAEASALQVGYSNLSLADSVQRREEATRRALELDDQLGEAYLSLATLHASWTLRVGRRGLSQGDRTQPGYATAYVVRGLPRDRFPARRQEALALARKAVELDPLSSIVRLSLAGATWCWAATNRAKMS
jgi:TolB-like protein